MGVSADISYRKCRIAAGGLCASTCPANEIPQLGSLILSHI